MASFNKVILMGHLTRDPEISQLPSGTPVCEFGLAVNRQWKDAQDAIREEVLFIDCTAFGKIGKAIGDHLTKGRPIHIEGHLKLDAWEAPDGSKRSKIRVIVEQFRFVDNKGKSATTDGATTSEGGDRVNGTPQGTGGKPRSAGPKAKRPTAGPGPLVGPAAEARKTGHSNSSDIPF